MSEKTPTLSERVTRFRRDFYANAWKLGALGAALLTPFGAYDLGHDRGSEPSIITDCEDAQVAAEGGDFAQAIRDAVKKVDADSADIDYFGLGGELSDTATGPNNPEGDAYPGHSVWASVGPDGKLEAYGHGTCPWPQTPTTPQS